MVNESLNILADLNQIVENFGLSELYARIVVSILVFIGFLIFGYILEHIFEHYFKKLAKKTKTKIDDEILKNVKRPIYILVLFFGLYFAIHNVNNYANYIDDKLISDIFLLIEILLIAYIFTRITNVLFAWYAERQERKKKGEKAKRFPIKSNCFCEAFSTSKSPFFLS